MNRIHKLSLLWLLPAALAAGCGSAQRVTVSNPLPFDRDGEMAQVPVNKIKSSLRKGGFVVTDPAGMEVPYQLTSDSLLIFPTSVASGASAVYTIKPGTPAPVKQRVYGRFFPEHKDNMNWENDKAAYTAYGPALQARGERGFGYDGELLVAPLLFRGRPANRIRRKKRTRGEAPENKQRSLKFFHTEPKCS